MQSSSLLVRGRFTEVNIANPAAGANFAWYSPNQELVEIVLVAFTLTTDATAATRGTTLYLVGSTGGRIWRGNYAQTQAASLVYNYYASSAPMGVYMPSAVNEPLSLPPLIPLPIATELGSDIVNIQATDQISAIRLCYLAHVAL